MSGDRLDLSQKLVDPASYALPIPTNHFIGFVTLYRVCESIAVVGMVICVFLLLSWTVLPAEKARSKDKYLSICLVIGILLEAVGGWS